jgi:hypothetical protein
VIKPLIEAIIATYPTPDQAWKLTESRNSVIHQHNFDIMNHRSGNLSNQVTGAN